MGLKEPNSPEIYELTVEGLCQLSQCSGHGDGRSSDYYFVQLLAPVRRTGRVIRR